MTGIVLGSGLGPLADALEVAREVPFADAGLPVSTVPGHSGVFIFGKLAGEPVVLMKGRVHLYEGHAPHAVTAGVRWMAGQGINRLILTNAAGTLNPDHRPRDFAASSRPFDRDSRRMFRTPKPPASARP
jgi:purine nucleoside phosphorylase